ncbi:MAG: Nif3-like dinuclear metal center hexameric protein, partial [Bacteroidetes bacterium]|nr:Nif3-like dinuclear metal center hexameric protein [Bacteroidota bacterium]
MKIKDVMKVLEEFAPLPLQESYDNSGLIVGDKQAEVNKILICLDSTEAVIDEAIAKGCNLIIAHHPIVFAGIKKLTGTNYIQRVIIKAIKNDIAIYAAHTNLDNVSNGVNAKICEKLGVVKTRILAPKKNLLKRLISFCPGSHVDKVKEALFNAGAGKIGEYDECSFSTSGTGTFRPSDKASPFQGEAGKRSEAGEVKIETIYPFYLEKKVLSALWQSHPYEEVAYDIIPLDNKHQLIGSGMIGELNEAMNEMDFLKMVKKSMKSGCLRYTQLMGKKVKKIAVCGGSGSFLLKDAIASGADVFLTADFKYHQFFDAEGQILIADVGHFESEQFTTEIFYDLLKKNFPTFAVCLS